MALEKSRQTINQLEHQLSLGDSAFAKKEADLRSSFSRRERELQDAFDELYERNQVRRMIPPLYSVHCHPHAFVSYCTSSCSSTARRISYRLRMRLSRHRASRQRSSRLIAPSTAGRPQIRLPARQTRLLKQRPPPRFGPPPPPAHPRHRRTKLSLTAATARWSK